MPLYKGFSTINRQKRFHLTDFDLVKQDLYNHLHIRKGEKLHSPNFGTIIWDLVFDELSAEIKLSIENDLNAVVNHDPRVSAESLIITEYENGLQIFIELRMLETNELEKLTIQFDRRNRTSSIT